MILNLITGFLAIVGSFSLILISLTLWAYYTDREEVTIEAFHNKGGE